MKKALVSRNRRPGRPARILELRNLGEEFPVAPSLEWVNVPDDTDPDRHALGPGASREDRTDRQPEQDGPDRLDRLIETLRRKGVLAPNEP